ncbi:MAG: SHOCT domain-containing protein [Propionicimonas sp.]
MMGYGGMGWGGMGWGGMIGMVVFWVVLIAAIVWAVTRLLPGRPASGGATQSGQEKPEDVLDRRYARGEIDLETYQGHRAALASARGEGLR